MGRERVKLAGWIGLGLLLAVGVAYAVRGMADALFWGFFVLGAGLDAWWLVEFRAEVREVLKERRTRQGANSLVLTLAVATILVLLQALSVAHSPSWDLSKDKSHTLSSELEKTVKNLDQNVEVKAFYAPGPEAREVYEELLQRARRLNPGHFSYEFINPNKEVMMARDLGVRSMSTSVVMVGDKHESFMGGKEEDLLNAILKVSSGGKKTVYVLAGHQEASINDAEQFGLTSLRKALDNATFVTKELTSWLAARPRWRCPRTRPRSLSPVRAWT
jgi:ABC-type uncharacterized transport system involved in gliding motility auxiliary subunit